MAKETLPTHIRTQRLALRPPTMADAPGIFEAYARDPAVCRYLVWRPHESVEQTERFLADCVASANDTNRAVYVLTLLNDTDAPVGMLDARIDGHTADLGYVLAPAQWGKGLLMPDALCAFTEIALTMPGLFRIQASCDIDNRASIRTLEKADFHREGRHERHTVHPNIDPDPRPCFMFARCR